MFLVRKPVSGFFSPTGVVAYYGVNYSTVLEESMVINLSENKGDCGTVIAYCSICCVFENWTVF